jgi:hypothetical protein
MSSTNRRIALQIASQLPDDPDDARAVLNHAMEIVDKFFAAEPQPLRSLDGGKLIAPNFSRPTE